MRVSTIQLSLATLLCLPGLWGCDRPRPGDSGGDPADRVTITLAYNRYIQDSFTDAPPPLEALRDAIQERDLGVGVALRLLPDANAAHRDNLVIWLMGNDASIDIFGVDAPWIPEFAESQWIEPLDDALPELDTAFLPTGLDPFRWQGRVFGVPFWSSVGGLYYRRDWLDAQGIAAPQTFHEFERAIARVTATNTEATGFLWAGGRNEDLLLLWSEVFLGFGGEFFAEDGSCAVDSEAGVSSVEWLRARLRTGETPKSATSWTAEEARQLFINGRALFLRHNHDMITWLDDPERSEVANRWGFTSMPSLEGVAPAAITGGFAWALNPNTPRREMAIEVLRLLASEEMQRAFAAAWGPVQFHRSLQTDTALDGRTPTQQSALNAVLPFAKARPQSLDYSRLSQTLQRELHAALTEQKTVERALADACAEIDQLANTDRSR